MRKNEGPLDRVLRAIIGLVLLVAGYMWLESPWSIVAYILGGIALLTAITGFCGLYKLFGIGTCKCEGCGSCDAKK